MRRLARWAEAWTRSSPGSEHLLGAPRAVLPGDAVAPSSAFRSPRRGERPPEPPVALRDARLPRRADRDEGGRTLLLAAAPALAARASACGSPVTARCATQVEGRAGVDYAVASTGRRRRGVHSRGCDAGIVPSTWEEPSGPPYTVCEWLAAGRPVLASRRGGLGEAGGHRAESPGFEPTQRGHRRCRCSGLRDPDAWEGIVATVPDGRRRPRLRALARRARGRLRFAIARRP